MFTVLIKKFFNRVSLCVLLIMLPFLFAFGVAEASDTQPLGNLPIGARVVDPSWLWEFRTGDNYAFEEGNISKSVIWIVVAKDHYGEGSGVTLLSRELVANFTYDNSTYNGGFDYGWWSQDNIGGSHWGSSGTYDATLGLRPWLNSTGIHAGEGFYNAFSDNFKNHIVTTLLPNKDPSRNLYYTQDRVFIPADQELGAVGHTGYLGTRFEHFTDLAWNDDRWARMYGETKAYWTRSGWGRVDDMGTYVELVYYFRPQGQGSFHTNYPDSFSDWSFDNVPYSGRTYGVRPVLNLEACTPVLRAPNPQGVFEIIPTEDLPDFWVDKVEFNQASQTFADETVKVAAEQLVTGKTTGVRVFVVGDNNEANLDEGKEAKEVTANLHIYKNGIEIGGSPFEPRFGPITPVANPSRTANQNGRATHTLDFSLPSFANPGEYQFFVYVNPDHEEDESDFSNNRFPSEGFETVTFHHLENVTVLPVYVTTVDGDGNVIDAFTDSDWEKLLIQRRVANKTYPRTIVWGTAQVINWNLDDVNRDLSTNDGRIALIAEMVDRSMDSGTQTAVAILPDSTSTGGANGFALTGSPGAAVATRRDSTLAHEIAHNLLPNPHFPGNIEDLYHDNTDSGHDGYDASLSNLKLNRLNILNSTGNDNVWISPTTYKALFENHALLSSVAVAKAKQHNQVETDALRIIGWIGDDGDLQLRPIRTIKTDVFTPEDPEGNYLLELRDEQGELLYEFKFNLPVVSAYEDDLKYGPFTLVVPRPEGLGSMVFRAGVSVLKHYDLDGQMDYSQTSYLGTVPVSANPPTVEILSPSGGEIIDGTFTIHWEGYDPDGDELYYTVLYSTDGQSWNVLSTNVMNTSLEWDFSTVPGSTEAFIRISATDGVNSASDQSGSFIVADKAPETYILQPENNEVFMHGEFIIFEGGADDLEDGELTRDQLEWASDIDGSFGTGENVVYSELSLGTHLVSLTATDSDGHKTTETIEIKVLDTLPLPPANVQARPGDNNVHLQWDASDGEYLAGYRVYWGMSSGVYDNNFDVGNQTSHTVANLANGTTYYFAVKAYDADGNYSDYSDEVQAVPEPADPTWNNITSTDAQIIATGGEVIAASFAGVGIGLYNGSWELITPATAVALATDGTILVASVENFGTWLYDGDWHQLTTATAQLLAVDNNMIAASFDGHGIWLYNNGWSNLTPVSAKALDFDNGKLVVSVDDYGIWLYDGDWTNLTAESADIVALDDNKLAASFTGHGIWLYEGDWLNLVPVSARALAFDNGVLAASVDDFGVWLYDGEWTNIINFTANLLTLDSGRLAASFEGHGVWLFE